MTTPHGQAETPGKKGLTRRTVTSGALWSIPAVTVAAAAPAFASSTDYAVILTSLTVAPQAGTGTGNQGVQALLTPASQFNTVANYTNLGPGDAASVRAQITFDQVSNNTAFSVSEPWVIDSITENTDLGRWLVNLTYNASVPSGGSIALVLTATNRIATQFPSGQSGAYQVLGRAYNSDGTINNDLSDYFYVLK